MNHRLSQLASPDPAARAQDTDADLWSAFVADPAAGVERLYGRYSSLVYGLARTILANVQESEDLTHEVFLSLLIRCEYDPNRGSLAGYLVAMTRSRAIDKLRSRRRGLRVVSGLVVLEPPEAHAAAAGDEASMDEWAGAVHRALADLPEVERRVLEMAYLKGLTQSEIAAQLAAPLGTVKSWARRGLLSLRGALKEFVD